MESPMLKIRRSRDRLIFNMGIPILVRRHLYIETPPGAVFHLWLWTSQPMRKICLQSLLIFIIIIIIIIFIIRYHAFSILHHEHYVSNKMHIHKYSVVRYTFLLMLDILSHCAHDPSNRRHRHSGHELICSAPWVFRSEGWGLSSPQGPLWLTEFIPD